MRWSLCISKFGGYIAERKRIARLDLIYLSKQLEDSPLLLTVVIRFYLVISIGRQQ